MAIVLNTASNTQTSVNSSTITSYDYARSCGRNNCPNTKLLESNTKPTLKSFYILYASLIGLCLLAILITLFFVDHIDDDDMNIEKQPKHANLGKCHDLCFVTIHI